MALQSQAQLLDELMGRNRNVGPGARINSVRFDDDDVLELYIFIMSSCIFKLILCIHIGLQAFVDRFLSTRPICKYKSRFGSMQQNSR